MIYGVANCSAYFTKINGLCNSFAQKHDYFILFIAPKQVFIKISHTNAPRAQIHNITHHTSHIKHNTLRVAHSIARRA